MLTPRRVDGEGHTAADREETWSAMGTPQEVFHDSLGSPLGTKAELKHGSWVREAGAGDFTWAQLPLAGGAGLAAGERGQAEAQALPSRPWTWERRWLGGSGTAVGARVDTGH